MNADQALWKASGVFAPSFPRQSSDWHTIQASRSSRVEFCEALQGAIEGGNPGYYSVYSFPRGHSSDGNIPEVDCIFIDLDVEGADYDPKNDKTEFDAWRRDMSALLARARMIAKSILDAGEQQHFRVTLSGHKGLHLYLDFPTLAPNNGSFGQFKVGLKEYGEQVMSWLDATAGGVNIDQWVDVDASDLGRLSRHPNTIHHDAAYDDETRWCVPITMDELAELHVDDYLELTREPRWPDGYQRTPSEQAGEKAAQYIREAVTGRDSSTGKSSSPESKLIPYYDGELGDDWYGDTDLEPEEEQLIAGIEPANEAIQATDIPFITSNKPCIRAFFDRDDAFEHGNASHLMEISVLGRLIESKVPREVIHDVFEDIPGYNESDTNDEIDKIIARQYGEFNCTKIANRAPMFCLGDQCSVYNRSADIQK